MVGLVVMLLFVGTAIGEVSREGLVAEWKFDEGAGNILHDSSGNGNDGIIYGATWLETNEGYVLQFDGINDYVDIPYTSLENLASGTIIARIKVDSNIGETIIAKQHNNVNTYGVFSIGYSCNSIGWPNAGTSGKLYYHGHNSITEASSSSTIDIGQWYNVANVFTNTYTKFYIEGSLDNTLNGDYSIPSDANPTATSIGAWLGPSGGRYFTGVIDEIRIYNRALTADEIKANYEAYLTTPTPKLTLTKSLSPSPITETDSTTITIKVENTGGDAAKNIKITDSTPQDFTLISGATSQEYTTLKAGEARTFQYIIKPTGTGKYVTEKATATYSDDEGNSYTSASNAVTISVSAPGTVIDTATPPATQQTSTQALPPTPAPESSNFKIYAGIGIAILLLAIIALRQGRSSGGAKPTKDKTTGPQPATLPEVKPAATLRKEPVTSAAQVARKDADASPNILVSITSSKGFKVGVWEKLDVNILNVGKGIAKDIDINLSGPLESSGEEKVSILEGKGQQADIVVGVKPKEPGNIPLKIKVTFLDQNGKHYEMKEAAFISVAKESETISMQQMPVINIGSYVGEQVDKSTNIVDSMVQRSNIGAGAKKCPNCGRDVEANEKFCLECGAKL